MGKSQVSTAVHDATGQVRDVVDRIQQKAGAQAEPVQKSATKLQHKAAELGQWTREVAPGKAKAGASPASDAVWRPRIWRVPVVVVGVIAIIVTGALAAARRRSQARGASAESSFGVIAAPVSAGLSNLRTRFVTNAEPSDEGDVVGELPRVLEY